MQNHDDQTDEQLAHAAQSGKSGVFDVLANRYRQKLTQYALRYAGSPEAASDVVQDVLIKAHQKIETFDTSRKFSPWIYRITHNEAINYSKKNNKKEVVSLDTPLSLSDERSAADMELSSLDKWFERELKEQIHDAINDLPDAYAEAIHLRYIEDLSYKEISQILDKPVNTVRTLVRRAKKKLLEILITQEKNL